MYTIFEHTIGTPDHIDRDLGKKDDCFLFDDEKEARRCADVMNESNNEYRYYAWRY